MMTFSSVEDFLIAILDCGYGDLRLIEDVKYDWSEILSELDIGIFRLNFIMEGVFNHGFGKMQDAIISRMNELNEERSYRELDDEEETELKKLQELNPFDDFSVFINFIDTHVWCRNNSEIYSKYMRDALDEFGDNTGFYIDI